MSPWQYTIFIVYKIKCCVIDWHVVFVSLKNSNAYFIKNEILKTSCILANNSHVERIKYFISIHLYVWNFKGILDIQCLMLSIYRSITFSTLSMLFHNCNSDIVKLIVSGKSHIELAFWRGGMELGNRQWWIYPSTSERLPLSLAHCHTKGDFDRISYYAQFKGNVKFWWTQLNRGYVDSSVTSATTQCSCCYRRRSKEANICHIIIMATGRGRTISFNVRFFVKNSFFEEEVTKKRLSSIPNHKLSIKCLSWEDSFSQLSISTHEQLQRYRLKFI